MKKRFHRNLKRQCAPAKILNSQIKIPTEYGHGNLQIYTKSLQSNLHGLQMKDKQDYTCCCYGCNTRDWPIVCQLYGLGDSISITMHNWQIMVHRQTEYWLFLSIKKQHITYTQWRKLMIIGQWCWFTLLYYLACCELLPMGSFLHIPLALC